MADNKSFRLFEKALQFKGDAQQFVSRYFNNLIEELNNTLQNLSLGRNFNGQVFENIEISATSTLRIYHKMGIEPKYKLVLKQSGGGLITDGTFSEKYVELYNSGASAATITFILLKE